jgi:hypothetical protein
MNTAYNFPNDEREQERLDLFHHLFGLRLDGKLHLYEFKLNQTVYHRSSLGNRFDVGRRCNLPVEYLISELGPASMP